MVTGQATPWAGAEQGNPRLLLLAPSPFPQETPHSPVNFLFPAIIY